MASLPPIPRNAVLLGDCVTLMRRMPARSVDFALVDPPYITRYSPRNGDKVTNDDNGAWLRPTFAELGRLLKPASFCVSFYGWARTDLFFAAWRAAGLRPVGHLVFRKAHASGGRFLRYKHEAAYLLAKGEVLEPPSPITDVIDMPYTGNKLHPTQKSPKGLAPLIEAFCPARGLVLDPMCGSGSTLVAAKSVGRDALGIELVAKHHLTASRELARAIELERQWRATRHEATRAYQGRRGEGFASRRDPKLTM